MILLIGGTSETAPIASGLARAGYAVLVSTATAVPLAIGEGPLISRRTGRLDEAGLIALAQERGIRAIVDAAHPYAVAAHNAAAGAARGLGIPCFVFRRPEALVAPDGDCRHCSASAARGEAGKYRALFAADHAEAAAIAFGLGRPVLLVTGSQNLSPYTEAARRTGVPVAVRVLDTPDSLAACRAAGIPEERVIAGRGPFSVEENLAAIRRFGIGVIVTKESGHAGGFDAKLAAAERAGCSVVIIRRPEVPSPCPVFETPAALIAALTEHLGMGKD